MQPSKRIMLRAEVIGFHHWPTPLPEVAYLGQEHRHRFGFLIEAKVRGSDREVEFHMLKRALLEVIAAAFPVNDHYEYQFGGRSCEAIGEMVAQELTNGGWPVTAVEVWEDDECGARVQIA